MATGRRVTVIVLRSVAGVLFAVALLAFAASAGLMALAKTLPDLKSGARGLGAPRTSIVYAADSSVIAEWHGDQDRKVVPLTSVPKSVRDAVVAAEDPGFYAHDGVASGAIAKALGIRNSTAGGHSTITQQLIKMLMAQQKRTFIQKVRETLMAYLLENKTPKDQTLEAYLNLVYFGDGRYGVESAARGYFAKPASELTLSEAALLAGIIDLPTKAAPTNDLKLATTRRDAVLIRMRDLAMITSDAEVAARKTPVVLNKTAAADIARTAPYFVEYVKQDLIARLGSQAVYTGGLRVYTTLRPAVQRQAEAAVASVLTAPTDPEAAVVSVIPATGEIAAMIGGRDFKTGQFNLAAQGRRQPGSAFKPFVLVAALEKGVSPDRQFETSPLTVKVKDGTWNVTNYENEFTTGQLTLRAATDWSVNAVFARLVLEVGPAPVVDAAKRMGITTGLNADPAIALGGLTNGVSPLEMASAYGTLASGGMRVAPTAIRKVTDSSGHVLLQPTTTPKRAIDQGVAAQVSGMLHDVVERGTGVNARFGGWAAGKTGTTQSYRDAWFVGYSGELCTAVWVGYRQAQIDMTNVRGTKVAGGTFPATIWGRYTAAALPVLGSSGTGEPVQAAANATSGNGDGTVHARICRSTFLLANPRCPDVVDVDLEPQLVPKSVCTKH